MGSLGVEVARRKAMWLYPKVVGVNPSERWGHSACYSNGFVYVFGGCCGGLHFSDVLVLNLETMSWNTLVTTGQRPGPQDSHSAVLVGQQMIVFGGTNGSKKVNDLHILDLRSREWTKPVCEGIPPSPRESHTATLVGDDKFVIFGGSGEGERNYLNDLYVLDLKSMRWTSPEVIGDKPVPRDSHSAVAIGNKLFVYGGDSGNRYQGNVDVLDMETLTWSRLDVHGPLPGVRAGHTSVNFGTKVYIIGGVGDKKYYNDVWVLNLSTRSWTQLDVGGQTPQGRFSHAAISNGVDIAIYGGCGEDEHPLNELLILQLGAEYSSGPRNISMCKIFGNHCNLEQNMFAKEAEDNSQKSIYKGHNEDLGTSEAQELEFRTKKSLRFSSDTLHPKRRRTSNSKMYDVELELEEHSLSLSQHSSPSQSDQEQTTFKKAADSVTATPVFPLFKQRNSTQSNSQSNPKTIILRSPQENSYHPMPEQRLHINTGRCHELCPSQLKSFEAAKSQNLIGAEIRGKVDGAFDSGLLMTATVNGRIYRGVLFAPGPNVVSRGTIVGQTPPPFASQMAVKHVNAHANYANLGCASQSQLPTKLHAPEPSQTCQQTQACRINPIKRSHSIARDSKLNSDLQGVVLTLRGPGSDHVSL